MGLFPRQLAVADAIARPHQIAGGAPLEHEQPGAGVIDEFESLFVDLHKTSGIAGAGYGYCVHGVLLGVRGGVSRHCCGSVPGSSWTLLLRMAVIISRGGTGVRFLPCRSCQVSCSRPAGVGPYLFDQTNGIAIAWNDGNHDYAMLTDAKYLVDWLSELI